MLEASRKNSGTAAAAKFGNLVKSLSDPPETQKEVATDTHNFCRLFRNSGSTTAAGQMDQTVKTLVSMLMRE